MAGESLPIRAASFVPPRTRRGQLTRLLAVSYARQVLRRARYFVDALAVGSSCPLKRSLGDAGVSHSSPVVEEQTVRHCREWRAGLPRVA